MKCYKIEEPLLVAIKQYINSSRSNYPLGELVEFVNSLNKIEEIKEPIVPEQTEPVKG